MITQQYSQHTHAPTSQDFIGQPYEDDSFDEIAYTTELIAAIKSSQAAVKRGEFITFEEFEKEFCSCIIE
ncbi:MAG: hypothetical protein WCO92_05645 [Verrucomicrobiota bacterium]